MTDSHGAARTTTRTTSRHQRRSLPGVRTPAGRGADLPQRARSTSGRSHVTPTSSGPFIDWRVFSSTAQRHPRHHQGRRRAPARGRHVRGLRRCTRCTAVLMARVFSPRRMAGSRTRSATSAPAASTSSSANRPSTSSPSSPRSYRCGVIGDAPRDPRVRPGRRAATGPTTMLRTRPGEPMRVKTENIGTPDLFADYIACACRPSVRRPDDRAAERGVHRRARHRPHADRATRCSCTARCSRAPATRPPVD